jgi:hypothetical protein
MAGSISLNPLMIIGEVLLIMSWKVAGYYGLDRYREGPARRGRAGAPRILIGGVHTN